MRVFVCVVGITAGVLFGCYEVCISDIIKEGVMGIEPTRGHATENVVA